MSRRFSVICVAAFLLGWLAARPARAAGSGAPLRATQVLALVAGDALPEDIVYEIQQRGLSFHPDDSYRADLKAMGADATVLAALDAGKLASDAESLTPSDQELHQHYVTAAQKIMAKDYSAATEEVQTILKSSIDGPSAAFVMGRVLRLQESFSEAEALYEQMLENSPDFPDIHGKLSYIEMKTGDDEEALREAKAQLALNQSDPEGHRDACLALDDMRKFDAASAECKEALRLKPNYAVAEMDLGLVYSDEGNQDDAIAAYKKADAMSPNDAVTLYDTGLAYERKGDLGSAVPYYRKAIAADPKYFPPHQNLGGDLIRLGMNGEAAAVFRDMQRIFPDAEVCHLCLGSALFNAGDYDGAEKEYNEAIKMDPGDPGPHDGIAVIRYSQRRYDEALAEYLKAEAVDDTYVRAHAGAGNMLLEQKEFAKASAEFKKAEDLDPSDANIHESYGQSLIGEGKADAAIGEFKEAISLDPKNVHAALDLATAQEKMGDWAHAMGTYRKAALTNQGAELRPGAWTITDDGAGDAYQKAQKRFADHLADLRSAGKSAEAASLEASVKSLAAAPSLSEQVNEKMEAGMSAAKQKHFEEAKQDYADAVKFAEQIQPHDPRLAEALDFLGTANMGQDFATADADFERELKVDEELYGPQSPNLAGPLASLGTSALLQKNYAAAEKFYFRAVDVTEKAYGESSERVAAALSVATRVYIAQQQYEKAEPYILRAERIDENVFGPDSLQILMPLRNVCILYDKLDKPEKAEPCYEHARAIGEKQLGADNPQILSFLTGQSVALRKLGRTDDADKVDARIAVIRGATMKSN